MSPAGTSLTRRGTAMAFSVCLHIAALCALLHMIPVVPQQARASGEKVLMARLLASAPVASSPAATQPQQAPAQSAQAPLPTPVKAAQPRAPSLRTPPPQAVRPLVAAAQAQAAAAPVPATESAPAALRPAVTEAGGAAESSSASSATTAASSATAATAVASSVPQSAPAAPAEPDTAARPDYAYNPRPEYPSIARQFGLSGKVLVRVYVAINGSPEQILIAGPSGYEVLDQAALKSVKAWRFMPARRAGRAYASWVEFNVMFDLTN